MDDFCFLRKLQFVMVCASIKILQTNKLTQDVLIQKQKIEPVKIGKYTLSFEF